MKWNLTLSIFEKKIFLWRSVYYYCTSLPIWRIIFIQSPQSLNPVVISLYRKGLESCWDIVSESEASDTSTITGAGEDYPDSIFPNISTQRSYWSPVRNVTAGIILLPPRVRDNLLHSLWVDVKASSESIKICTKGNIGSAPHYSDKRAG